MKRIRWYDEPRKLVKKMSKIDSVKPTTKNSANVAKATARILLGNALGFRDCTSFTLDTLVNMGVVRTLSKGEILVPHNMPFTSLYLVIRGTLETSILRFNGQRHLVGFLQSGDVAGLVSLTDGLGNGNDLCAREPATTVLIIPLSVIDAARKRDDKLGRAFELQLAFRTRLLYERLSTNPAMPLKARLARLISTLAGLYGAPEANGDIRLAIKISQVDLADWLGVSRERTNSAIQQLKTDGLINLSYSTITVIDKAGLALLSSL